MGERGTVLPVLALLLAGGALAVALCVEVGRCGAAWREASFAADTGAEAGAAALDRRAAYAGVLRLDPDLARAAAEEAALAARPRPERRVSATAGPGRVCVTVHQPFPAGLLAPVVRGRVITATACASPARG